MGDRSDKGVVREHLATGCGTCLLAVKRFQEIAALEEQAKPRMDWVRPGRLPVSTFGRRDDSRLDLHYVTRIADLELDVLIRRRPHVGTLLVAGQLTIRRLAYEPAADVVVMLVDGNQEPVAGGRTDEFGEFEFEARIRSDYGLRITRGDTHHYVLVWQTDPVSV
ncbi:MAG: hypothetical protein OER88_04250 [Planctomycetota bacterium]|nr:hypothetical protein [Planctomycetota bacterium]